jgi:hypothetical protein
VDGLLDGAPCLCELTGCGARWSSAALLSPDGSGIRVFAYADAHVRACLDPAGVLLHVLSRCSTGPAILKTGDHIRGEVVVQLVKGKE